MNKHETDSHILERDEVYIDNLIRNGEFKLIDEKKITHNDLLNFLVSTLEPLYKGKTAVVTITGAPASGKDTLVQNLTEAFSQVNHPTGSIDTDGFNKDTRINRNNKIKEGVSPLDVKDFGFAKEIVAKIRQGNAVKVPLYHEETGEAIIAPLDTWKQLPAGLHFLFFSGDYQPLDDPDYRMYFHVPTKIRRDNRVRRDVDNRQGYGDAEAIVKNFDERLASQYYPFTLPQAEKADILIIATPENPNEPADKEKNSYTYHVFKQEKE